MKIKCCSAKVLLIVALAFLVLFVGCLLLAFIGFPIILDDEIKKAVRLEDNSTQWERFEELPFPVDFKVYIFEVTNADKVLNENAKPELEERGPYFYKQTRAKNILSYNEIEDTVTYEQTELFEFDPEQSTGTQDDKLTVINPAMLSIIQLSSDMEQYLSKGCLDKIFPDEYNKLFIDVKVRDILFEGITFSIDVADPICAVTNWIVRMKAKKLRNSEPILDENNNVVGYKFSFFKYKNNTSDGTYTVKRGLDDIATLGSIVKWNNSKHLNYWGRENSTNNETCSLVRGTDSTLYPPHVKDDTVFEIFTTDLCRSVPIGNVGEATYLGVTGAKFEANSSTLKSSLDNVENDCFCTKQTLDEKGNPSCFLNGIIDMKPCFGAPVLFSFPHFLWADESYQSGVKGLNPDEDKHRIYLLVEPNSGTPLEGKKRIQLNVAVRPEPYIPMTKNLPSVILPMLWIEEGISLQQKYIDELYDRYFNKVKLVDGVRYGLIGVTAAGFLIFGGLWVYMRNK